MLEMSAAVSCPEGIALLLRFKGKGFWLSVGRICPKAEWNGVVDGFPGDPAEPFSLKGLGIPDDLLAYYSGRAWTNSKAREWFRKKLRKAIPEGKFLREESFPVGISLARSHPGRWVWAKISRKIRGA